LPVDYPGGNGQEYNERSGQRINRNDILRHLVDRCSLEDLADLRDLQQ